MLAADHGSTPTPAHAEAQKAALDAVEPERLLDGEDEDTSYLDDAVHWTKVYMELLDFKRSLLAVAEDGVTAMHDDAGSEVKDTDLKVLKAEAARFERRLDVLAGTDRQLQGSSAPNPHNSRERRLPRVTACKRCIANRRIRATATPPVGSDYPSERDRGWPRKRVGPGGQR